MAYPTPAPARPVPLIRVPVAVLVPLAIVAVAGLMVWGGGETPQYAGAGGDRGGFSAGGSSSGAAGDSPGGPGTATALPTLPLDPSLAGTFVGEPVPPTESGASHAWRLGGEWTGQLSVYQEVFPIAGYRMGEQRITDSGGGGAWDIVVDQAQQPSDVVGLLYFGPDPADPSSSTIIEIDVY